MVQDLFVVHYKCICINICNYFKSHRVKFNVNLFGIGDSAPSPWFDKVELLK